MRSLALHRFLGATEQLERHELCIKKLYVLNNADPLHLAQGKVRSWNIAKALMIIWTLKQADKNLTS
jgi:hypothetical protein